MARILAVAGRAVLGLAGAIGALTAFLGAFAVVIVIKVLLGLLAIAMLAYACSDHPPPERRLNPRTPAKVDGTWFRPIEGAREANDIALAPGQDVYVLGLTGPAKSDRFVARVTSGGDTAWLHTVPSAIQSIASLDGIGLVGAGYNYTPFPRGAPAPSAAGARELRVTFLLDHHVVQPTGLLELYNESGERIWSRTVLYGLETQLLDVAAQEKSIFVAGYSIDDETARSDALLARYDTQGNEVWSLKLRGPSDDGAISHWLTSVVPATGGRLAVAGVSVMGAGESDGSDVFRGATLPWLALIDEAGTVIWTQWLDSTLEKIPPRDAWYESWSKRHYEPRHLLVHTTDEAIFVARSSYSKRPASTLHRFEYDARPSWVINLSERHAEGRRFPIVKYFDATAMSGDSNSGVLLAGLTNNPLDRDLWLARVGSNGSISWQVMYGAKRNLETFVGVVASRDGAHILALGNLHDPWRWKAAVVARPCDAWLFRFDSEGRLSAAEVNKIPKRAKLKDRPPQKIRPPCQ